MYMRRCNSPLDLYACRYRFLINICMSELCYWTYIHPNQHLYVRVVLLNIHTSFVIQHGLKNDMMHEKRLSKYHILAHHQIAHKYNRIHLSGSSITSSLIIIIQHHHFVINQRHMVVLSHYFHRCIYTYCFIIILHHH
jgi:hypothetical protein